MNARRHSDTHSRHSKVVAKDLTSPAAGSLVDIAAKAVLAKLLFSTPHSYNEVNKFLAVDRISGTNFQCNRFEATEK